MKLHAVPKATGMQQVPHSRTSGLNFRNKNFHKSHTLMWVKYLLDHTAEALGIPSHWTLNPQELRNCTAPWTSMGAEGEQPSEVQP